MKEKEQIILTPEGQALIDFVKAVQNGKYTDFQVNLQPIENQQRFYTVPDPVPLVWCRVS